MPVIDRAMAAARPLPQQRVQDVMAGRAAVRALLMAGGAT